MPKSFAELASELYEIAAAESGGSDDVAYLTADARRAEVAEAEPCVRRLVELELDPPKGEGAGRGPGAHAPTLAKTLRKDLPGMAPEDLDWLTDTATASIGRGYVNFSLLQTDGHLPSPESGQDAKELWERWMLLIASDALDKSTAGQAGALIEMSGRHLRDALEEREFVGAGGLRRGGWKSAGVRQTSEFYARAGLTLRMLQSTRQFDAKPHRSQQKALPNWPFEPVG